MPVCSFCKKVRDDEGYWNQVEVYVKQHSEVDFSHGICPECIKIHYPKEFDKIQKMSSDIQNYFRLASRVNVTLIKDLPHE